MITWYTAEVGFQKSPPLLMAAYRIHAPGVQILDAKPPRPRYWLDVLTGPRGRGGPEGQFDAISQGGRRSR